ncbi:MAG: 50S ribosomal protein L6 [Alphaproteobacteria bacterium]|nr:50S ribosomal protein L6 [Alphaproteobacteria bacterium]
MSRIGNAPIVIPEGVTPTVSGQDVTIKGPKGELTFRAHDDVAVKMEDGKLVLSARSQSQRARQIWPTNRTRVYNMVVGVTEGYMKKLEIKGVGYRANLQGKDLVLALGFSHEVRYPVPSDVKLEVVKQTAITITGIDKQRVGQVAAEIREFRKPEPYKGKGIRYADEYIVLKEGKKK